MAAKQRVLLFLVVVLLTASCGPESIIKEVKPCQGPEVDNWFKDTYRRIEVVNSDPNLTTDDLQKLYDQQQKQMTHICMSQAQEYATNIFYHQWQASQAIREGDLDKSFDHLKTAKEAYDMMVQEINRLAKEYDWEQ